MSTSYPDRGPRPTIREATVSDLPALTEILADVFSTDATMAALVAHSPDPRRTLGRLIELELAGHYLPAGAVDLVEVPVGAPTTGPGTATGTGTAAGPGTATDGAGAGPTILAAAVWDPPVPGPAAAGSGAQPAAGPESLAAGSGPWDEPTLEAQVRAVVGEQDWPTYVRCSEMAAQARPAGPHWYLYLLAVAPAGRGGGLGPALLTHGLARADAGGLPVHLEATTTRSRDLYSRHGFAVVDVLEPTGPLPRNWAMTRPGRRPGGSHGVVPDRSES